MEDYVDIKEYKFEHFSTKTANPFLILITFLFLVLTIYLLFSQKQKVFFNGVGLVQEENLVGIEVSKENEKKILNKNKIIIEGTTFTYKIIEKNIPHSGSDFRAFAVLVQYRQCEKGR